MTSRRRFISLLPLLGTASLVHAQAVPVDPKDPQAVALGYTPDATKADKTKYPKYAPPQACANCALYQGAAGSTSGLRGQGRAGQGLVQRVYEEGLKWNATRVSRQATCPQRRLKRLRGHQGAVLRRARRRPSPQRPRCVAPIRSRRSSARKR
jgi:hypothetical protein